MNLYDSLWGNDVKFILNDTKGQITKVYGKEVDKGPLHLKHPPQGFAPGYPAYNIINVNGITEIVEYRKPEPVFYITDDPIVWKELLGNREIGNRK
jgi:hypothetical protein